jgi:hypothetical protein
MVNRARLVQNECSKTGQEPRDERHNRTLPVCRIRRRRLRDTAWTDNHGRPEDALSRRSIIDNLMLD